MANLLYNLYVLDDGVPNSAHFFLEAIFIYFIFFVPQFDLKW